MVAARILVCGLGWACRGGFGVRVPESSPKGEGVTVAGDGHHLGRLHISCRRSGCGHRRDLATLDVGVQMTALPPNNAFDRTVNHRGAPLPRETAAWPTAQLSR